MRRKMIALALILPLLAGCQTVSSPTPVPVPLPRPAVLSPQPVVMRTVQWRVYTRAELKQLLEKAGTANVTIFAVTPKGYQALALNLIELERYIKEQKQVIEFLTMTLDQRASDAPRAAKPFQ